MRNFLRIGDGVDVLPIMAALAARPDLWNEHPIRTTYPNSPHAEVDDILCMFNDLSGGIVDDINVVPFRAWFELPIREIVLNLMRRVNGVQLGRVIISRLAPGKSIAPHADQGAPATYYQRYQLMLQSRPGCILKCGGEVIAASAGEVWWFDNTLEHDVVNNSDSDRIAMIVDVRQC